MLMKIYSRAFKVLMKKPLKLWGLSLLSIMLIIVLTGLCGVVIPGLALGVTMLMTVSMTMVYLSGYRGEEVKAVQLFSCFKDWNTIKRVLCGMAWTALWVFLWGMIPIVGWIFALIRIYEYRLVPYILVTEPDVPVTEALKVSAERTKGYKLQMWLADFVFAIVTFVVMLILGLLSIIPYIGVLFALVAVVTSLVTTALSPLFLGLVQAAFYEEITNPTAAAAADTATGVTCAGCGAALAEGTKFCPNCGKSVE